MVRVIIILTPIHHAPEQGNVHYFIIVLWHIPRNCFAVMIGRGYRHLQGQKRTMDRGNDKEAILQSSCLDDTIKQLLSNTKFRQVFEGGCFNCLKHAGEVQKFIAASDERVTFFLAKAVVTKLKNILKLALVQRTHRVNTFKIGDANICNSTLSSSSRQKTFTTSTPSSSHLYISESATLREKRKPKWGKRNYETREMEKLLKIKLYKQIQQNLFEMGKKRNKPVTSGVKKNNSNYQSDFNNYVTSYFEDSSDLVENIGKIFACRIFEKIKKNSNNAIRLPGDLRDNGANNQKTASLQYDPYKYQHFEQHISLIETKLHTHKQTQKLCIYDVNIEDIKQSICKI
jgi:hypothetical protein